MADSPATNAAPKPRARKATPRKTATNAPAAKKSTKRGAAAEPSFSESIDLARAAVNSATAAAKAKLKGAQETARTQTANAKAKTKSATDAVSAFDWRAQADEMTAQAGKYARDAAGTAKTKTGAAMTNLAKLIDDTAQTVDTKLGPQYGDYTRQAASAVASAAKSLDDKDIDQLMAEARNFVRKSPAVAIGAAAVAGYVMMRLAKGSSNED